MKFLLSGIFSQDPIEEYFGCQRGRGRRSDNPTADSFLHNNLTLTTVGTLCEMGPLVRDNVRGLGQQHSYDIDELSMPLPKRRQLHEEH